MAGGRLPALTEPPKALIASSEPIGQSSLCFPGRDRRQLLAGPRSVAGAAVRRRAGSVRVLSPRAGAAFSRADRPACGPAGALAGPQAGAADRSCGLLLRRGS